MWQRHLERGPVRSHEIQRRPNDVVAPSLRLFEQPLGRCFSCSTSDYVQQLSSPPHQLLIETQRLGVADALDISLQQRLTPTPHRRVERMPIASRLRNDLFERAATARLARHSPTSPGGQSLARRRNRGDLFGDRTRRPLQARARPTALVPHQQHKPPQRGEVHQLHQFLTIRPQQPVASPTARSRCPSAEMNLQRLTGFVVDADHINIAQPNLQLTHTCRFNFNRDPLVPRMLVSTDSEGYLAVNRGPSPHRLRPQTRFARNPGLKLHRTPPQKQDQSASTTFSKSYDEPPTASPTPPTTKPRTPDNMATNPVPATQILRLRAVPTIMMPRAGHPKCGVPPAATADRTLTVHNAMMPARLLSGHVRSTGRCAPYH